jgi:hypothetical protein
MIRVEIPHHLRTLANTSRVVELDLARPVTIAAVLDSLEARYPMLQGTLRDHATRQYRPFIRFFACGLDLTHDPPDSPLPEPVVTGQEVLRIVGAMAGG